MTNRRRLLLSYLANSFKYLPYSYEYLYYGLVPTTIDSKQVRNKAKVRKLYGNSVVENQLVQNGNFEDTSGWSGYNGTISVSNNILSYSISYLGGDYGSNRVEQQFTNINNHYYLVDVYIKTPYATTVRLYTGEWVILGTTNANQWTRFTQIFEKTGSSVGNNSLYFDVHGQASYQVGDVIQVKQYQKKDITQRHPFNTPTTLTDNRVQAILNRGYIPYNLGELKSVDIGEISSEPYNLFDEDNLTAVHKYVNSSNGVLVAGNNNNYAEEEYIKVVGGKSYSFSTKYQASAINNLGVGCYDKDKNFITRISLYSPNAYNSFTLPTNCEYIRISFAIDVGETVELSNNQICFHRTGTRTGYAPYQAPQTITFKYQGSGVGTAHDTYELTKTAHVFTKNMANVDFGTLTWSKNSDNNFYSTGLGSLIKKPLSNHDMANAVCGEYKIDTLSNVYNNLVDKSFAIHANDGTILIRDTLKASIGGVAFKESVEGVILQYPLETPQVITIPRKHLWVVDLGSLNYTSSSSYGAYSSSLSTLAKKPSNNNTSPNIYCSLYTTSYRSNYSNSNRKLITIDQSGDLDIEDSSLIGLTNAQIQAKLSGILLFYETENEVADITDTFDIQSGGTINTDSNVLPNADFLMKCK